MVQPILISGAGLGGLLLARSLQSSHIPFEIYERDASIAVRGQGYRIRISTDGLTALQTVLTPAAYETFKAGCSQTGGGGIHSFEAVTGEPAPSDISGGPGGRGPGAGGPKLGGDVLGVDRGFLRRTLLAGMEDAITFGKQVVGYDLTDTGVKVRFRDGTVSSEGSLLVGADGAHSIITKQLTEGAVRTYDTGARMIHGQTPARAFRELGEGVFSVRHHTENGGKLGLITNVRPGSLPDAEIGWVFVGGPGTFSAPDDNFSIVGQVAADLIRELTSSWHPKFRTIFDQQNDAEAAFLKMSTARPEGVPGWANQPRVTLLGDAVHAMTPAGGVGANTALKDAAFIGRLLKDGGGWQPYVTDEYEKEMRVYASANVAMSFETAAKQFDIKELK
ncbi:hypothetical protein P7C73_g783, partial [Tremellales sp. Uapishka_1]